MKKAQAIRTWAFLLLGGGDRRYETYLHFFLRMLDDGYIAVIETLVIPLQTESPGHTTWALLALTPNIENHLEGRV